MALTQEARREKGLSSESEEEEEQEIAPAKGNSVFDAPKVDLAAGRQLGFTPSSAGNLSLGSSTPQFVV